MSETKQNTAKVNMVRCVFVRKTEICFKIDQSKRLRKLSWQTDSMNGTSFVTQGHTWQTLTTVLQVTYCNSNALSTNTTDNSTTAPATHTHTHTQWLMKTTLPASEIIISKSVVFSLSKKCKLYHRNV